MPEWAALILIIWPSLVIFIFTTVDIIFGCPLSLVICDPETFPKKRNSGFFGSAILEPQVDVSDDISIRRWRGRDHVDNHVITIVFIPVGIFETK